MSPWTGPAAALAARVAAFVDGSLRASPPEPLEPLLLDVHRWQVGQDRVLAALTERPPTRWSEIPAVPVSLFRDLPVGAYRGGDPGAVVFRTSGTTSGARGEHHLRSTALYDRGAIAWARRCVPGIPPDTAALLEDPAKAPDSSLSHMVASFGPAERATWHVERGVVDRDGFARRVHGAGPLFVPTTGFALADLLDREPPPLPPGSVVMVTGGFKGRRVEVDARALCLLARERLRPARLVTEYGMTELSSQLWGAPELAYLPPPWLKVAAVDLDGRRVPAGQAGQLRFYDLCNLDSTVGVETMDSGIVRDDGTVELLGRLSGAEVRGCSLTVEEAWGR